MAASSARFISCQEAGPSESNPHQNQKATKKPKTMQFYLLKKSCFPKLIFYKIKWCSFFSVNIKLITFKKSCWCTISFCDDMFFQYELFVGKKRATNTNYSSCSYFLNFICPHQYVVLKLNNCSNTGECWKPSLNMGVFLTRIFLIPRRKGRTNGLRSLHFREDSKCPNDLVIITGFKSTMFSVFV